MPHHPRRHQLSLIVVLAALLLAPFSGLAAASITPQGPADPTQPQMLPDGSIVGVPWTGEKGITETVAQIMERERNVSPANTSVVRAKPLLVPDRPKAENPNAQPLSQWPPAPATNAPMAPFSPQTVSTSFLGVVYSESGYIPPDSMGDAGPTQILMHENGRIKVFDKAGVVGGLNASDATFWASVTTGISDPEVRYDRLSSRWFIIAISLESTNNKIVVAVSSGPTITNQASFTFYSFAIGSAISGDSSNFCDYPSLGVDANALYTGCNMFASTYQHSSVFVIRKSSVTSDGPIVVTGFGNVDNSGTAGPYSPRGVDNDDACATEGYFIGPDTATYSTLQIRRVLNPGATPTLSGNLTLNVATTTGLGTQLHPSNTTQARGLDTIDDRLFQAAIHKNKITGVSSLWTAHHVEVDATCAATTYNATTARVGARWYEIGSLTGTPSVSQYGTLCTTSGTSTLRNSLRGYLFPTVAETGQGHMALGATYAGSNPGEAPGVAVTGRLRTDAGGTLQAVTLAQTGTGTYRLCDGFLDRCPRNRWGDYSFTDVDPTDDMTVWTFQEYVNATDSWAVRATQLKAPAPPPSSPTPATIAQGATSRTVVCNRTSGTNEFFDPGTESCGGPGWTNHLSATATNNVTVNSITFNSVSQVTLDLNTTSSSKYTNSIVTIANPDGQTATCTVYVGSPTAVTLESLSAAVEGSGVSVAWVTAQETDNQGFNLYRDTSPAGPGIKLNAAIIPSKSPGGGMGASYQYVDTYQLVSGTTYYYWLEDVSLGGVVTRHEPVSVTYTGPTAVALADYNAAAGVPWAGLALALVALGLALAFQRSRAQAF